MFLGRAETGFLAYAGGGVTDVINCGGVVGRGGTMGGGLSSSAMDCCLSLTMMYCFYTSYFTTHSKRQHILCEAKNDIHDKCITGDTINELTWRCLSYWAVVYLLTAQ